MKLGNIIATRETKKVYRDGAQAIKVFEKGYNKSEVLNEALNQARVEETGIRVPKVQEVTKLDGCWAIVSEYIEGKTLQQLMDETPGKKAAYITRLVDIQLEMHAHKAPMLNAIKDKMQRKISATTFDATTRYELHTRLASMPDHNKVCHGDFDPTNIIITPEDEAYILDWSHATQGNASADAARTYLLFYLAGDEEGAEMYLDTFCKKSDTAKQYVQKWIPIVAASQTVKGKTQERAFLERWVNVVEYE